MKPGVFTQIYIHLVFAVKYRERVLKENHRPQLFKYLSGIVTNKEHKSIIINGMQDHMHILIGLNPKESISTLIGDLKRSSSIFINENKLFPGKFAWQAGYGAFSYSLSQLNNLYQYILNQPIHHKRKTFREEYISLLKRFKIEYDEKYIFEFFE
jgi:REP element-mobilizing transposase RayT